MGRAAGEKMATRARSARARLGMETENIIGENLRQLRRAHPLGLTVEAFCQRLEDLTGLQMTKGTLSKIENGQRAVYDYEVARFALVLGVTVDLLYDAIPKSEG